MQHPHTNVKSAYMLEAYFACFLILFALPPSFESDRQALQTFSAPISPSVSAPSPGGKTLLHSSPLAQAVDYIGVPSGEKLNNKEKVHLIFHSFY